MRAEETRVGRFQILVVALLTVNYAIVAMNHALPIFHNYTPEFRCESREAGTNERQGNGNGTNSCGGKYVFAVNNGERSVATEWFLVHERRYLALLGPTVYHVGLLLGAWIAGLLSDRIGRFPVQAVCLYAQGTLAVSLYVVQDYPVFLVVRGLQGLFVQGLQNSTYVLSLELFPARSRTFVALILQIAWALGLLLLAILAYLVSDWRILQLVVSVPTALTVLYIWVIPESPRWLLAKGKCTEADLVFERITRYNGFCAKPTRRREKSLGQPPDERDTKEKCSSKDLEKDETTNLLVPRTGSDRPLSCNNEENFSTVIDNERDDEISNRNTANGAEGVGTKDDSQVPSTSKCSSSLQIDQRKSFVKNVDESVEEKTCATSNDEKRGYNATSPTLGDDIELQQTQASETSKSPKRTVFRKYGILMACQWFASATAVYLVESFSPTFQVNRHVNFALSAVLEIVACTMAYIVLNKFGRRFPLCVYQLVNAVICVITIAGLLALPNNFAYYPLEVFKIVVLLCGRAIAVGTTFILYLYTVEVFPTTIRGTFLALCTAFAKIGTLCTPHLLLSGIYVSVFIPTTIIGVICLVSGIVAPFLPDTSDAILPDTPENAAVVLSRSSNCRTSENVEADPMNRETLRSKLFSEDWVDVGNGILVNFSENKNND